MKIPKKRHKYKMGPIDVKLMLLVRKDVFNNALIKERKKYGMPESGFLTELEYALWLNDIDDTRAVFEDKLRRKSAYAIAYQFKLSANYIDGIYCALMFGKKINEYHIGWHNSTYSNIQSIKDPDFKEERLFIEAFPETSYEDIQKHWKTNKLLRNHFLILKKYRPYKNIEFDLEVYDIYMESKKGEKVKVTVDKMNKKYKGRNLKYYEVNKIVNKIKNKIASV